MPNPAYCRPAAFDAFRQALQRLDTTRGLHDAAVAISLHADPAVSVDGCWATVAELGDTVSRRVRSASDAARLAHLHDVLFEVVGFAGDTQTYYSPANSYLPEVLRRRRGIPITLVLVYKLVAERVGLSVRGVNAPGHFLAEVACREPTGPRRLYVDPFFGGGLLTAEEAFDRVRAATGQPLDPSPALLRPATPLAWLSRMLLNLQAVFAHQGSERDLLAMQELQAAITELGR